MRIDNKSRDFKKRLAKDYYLYSPYTQAEIAERVGVSPQTITSWKEEEGWEELKQQLMDFADRRIRNYAKLLDLFSKKIEEEDPNIDELTKLQSLLDKNSVRGTEADEIEKVGLALIRYLDEKLPAQKEFFLKFYRDFAKWYSTQR